MDPQAPLAIPPRSPLRVSSPLLCEDSSKTPANTKAPSPSRPSSAIPVTEAPLEQDTLERWSTRGVMNMSTDAPPKPVRPTAEELHSLRRVPGRLSIEAKSVALLMFWERWSYYGTVVLSVNFLQQPLPRGSPSGAGQAGQSGALGMGQRVSTGIVTFIFIFVTLMPLLGAYIADQYLGRYKTIHLGIWIAFVGHVFLAAASLPSIIAHKGTALALFVVGALVMSVGTGGVKTNLGPFMAEQDSEEGLVVETQKSRERVIVDPSITLTRMFNALFFGVNVAAVTGHISMAYVEKYVGFWLAQTIPTISLLLCPLILLLFKRRYVLTKPAGSVMGKTYRLSRLALMERKRREPEKTWLSHMRSPDFWQPARPSNQAEKPRWMDFDDPWVDEVSRGFKACKVFLWFPLYFLAASQIGANLTSQAATLQLNGVPNDIIHNINPMTLIILIPLADFVVYPFLRRCKVPLSPTKRMTLGFVAASLGMMAAAVIQARIYYASPCGIYADHCARCEISGKGLQRPMWHAHYESATNRTVGYCNSDTLTRPRRVPAPISVWIQAAPLVLLAISEILILVTGMEFAYKQAPANMKSLVTAVFYSTMAVGAIFSQALLPLAEDPYLVWHYGVVAFIAALGAVGFGWNYWTIDKEGGSDEKVTIEES